MESVTHVHKVARLRHPTFSRGLCSALVDSYVFAGHDEGLRMVLEDIKSGGSSFCLLWSLLSE